MDLYNNNIPFVWTSYNALEAEVFILLLSNRMIGMLFMHLIIQLDGNGIGKKTYHFIISLISIVIFNFYTHSVQKNLNFKELIQKIRKLEKLRENRIGIGSVFINDDSSFFFHTNFSIVFAKIDK